MPHALVVALLPENTVRTGRSSDVNTANIQRITNGNEDFLHQVKSRSRSRLQHLDSEHQMDGRAEMWLFDRQDGLFAWFDRALCSWF